ncbi:MAG: molybdopterin-dependent oxidoreductase [Rubripirellula sp.]
MIESTFRQKHNSLTRRYFLRLAALSTAALTTTSNGDETPKRLSLESALDDLESYLTRDEDFQDVSRGKPKPHRLTDQQKHDAGMTKETWRLEVISDPEHPANIQTPLTKESGTALDWDGLQQLAKTKAVRFPKVMTCLNIGCPLGMGIWEGVPLRDVVWMTNPTADLRRVFYSGYHNDDPKQIFRSSLPIGRVLEDPTGLPPVILCYKLNGDWLSSERGGPVRIVVPEAYGFKSVKWINRLVLSNLFHANDTYAEKNNDIDSPLKTFAATIFVPDELAADQPIPITGYAQAGIAGLSKVQTLIYPFDQRPEAEDPNLTRGEWRDADILGVPDEWGGDLPENRIPTPTHGFDEDGKPSSWPMRLSKAHWATLLPGLPPGKYKLRCRTIDQNGQAQPMPRPFAKSGRTAIEQRVFVVKPT